LARIPVAGLSHSQWPDHANQVGSNSKHGNGIDHEEFLRRAPALAERKAAERARDGVGDEVGDVDE
jgi:hypothetical protein